MTSLDCTPDDVRWGIAVPDRLARSARRPVIHLPQDLALAGQLGRALQRGLWSTNPSNGLTTQPRQGPTAEQWKNRTDRQLPLPHPARRYPLSQGSPPWLCSCCSPFLRPRHDEYLAKRAIASGFQDHPGQTQVEGHRRDLATVCREPLARVGGPSTCDGPREVICRMTDARLVRRMSGSVNSARASKFSWKYSRMQLPSETRPHHPVRWLALALEMASIGRC